MTKQFLMFYLKILGVYLALVALPGRGQSPLEPQESFYSRPDIKNVIPQALKNPKEEWVKTRQAHLRFTALLYMYPENYEFRYLHRDAETGEDVARELITEPEMLKRIGSLNVTRANMKSPNLWDYLEQEGINSEDPDKVFLLIDSGMNGQIPDHLRATSPPGFKSPIQGHFFMSANASYASSRTYLTSIDPKSLNERVELAENIIVLLEHIPHYTHSSSGFRINPKTQKWEPVTKPQYQMPTMSMSMNSMGFGGELLEVKNHPDKRATTVLMKDLKAYLQSPQAQAEFKNHARIWKSLAGAYQKSVETNDPSLIEDAIEKLHKKGTGDAALDQSIAMDFLEIIRINSPRGVIPKIKKIENGYLRRMKCVNLIRKTK